MALTPGEEKQKSDWVRMFGEDWELRPATREIARKNKSWFLQVWPRQHKVPIMYLWIKFNWSQFSNSNLPFPLDYDNLPKTPGQPVLYAVLGGWTIPKRDLPYLTDGPLYGENWELLVPAKREGWQSLMIRGWKLALGAAAISGIAAGIFWLYP